ncbi:MAG: MFS transporter [Dissulfurispiraceae bacterium]|jgi:UMF1 family MFS transporter|nr:MFS transporter [Dissulfurispiraceae bacterium]
MTKRILDKKVVSWCLFDLANSSYSAVIAAVIFPVYFTTVLASESGYNADLWWGSAISLSMAFVAVTSPVMGGLADSSGLRKRLLIFYTLLCIAAVSSFWFLQKGLLLEAFFLVVAANIGMEGGLVFYNSFLPDIAPCTHQGRISAWGYGTGYAGSVVSLIIALLIIKFWSIEYVWPTTALFFLLFSLPAFINLPADSRSPLPFQKAAALGMKMSLSTLGHIWSDYRIRKFMISYLLYEDGVSTVIVFSSIFAAFTLGFRSEELILVYLIVQGTALLGSFAMASRIDTKGPKSILSQSLILWAAVCCAVFFVQSKTAFFLIASVAGLGLGTVQAASRAFFTQFIPEGREAEYFGAYSLVGKSSAVIGPLVFGIVSSTMQSQRWAVLALSLFFVLGLLILRGVDAGYPNETANQES